MSASGRPSEATMIHVASVGDKRPSERSRNRCLRKETSDDLSVEELFPDDMGYDADAEAVHPDTYEEPESDTDQPATPRKKFFSVDDDLAHRMRLLSHERSGTASPQTPSSARATKRRSRHDDYVRSLQERTSDFEITEVVERSKSNPSPPKKRQRKSLVNSSGHRSDDFQASALLAPPRGAAGTSADAMDTT